MDKINQLLTRRVEKIYPSKKALEKLLRSGKKLRLYQGFDPSTPNLHIGHLVGLLTLKNFQALGHEVIFLIGDFTGMIGDPTGKIKDARPQLSHAQVLKNAEGYKKQAGMVLNFSGSNPIKLKYNSQWLSKLSALEAIRLMHLVTYAQIIERDMFQKRIKEDKDIYLNEFIYPILQAYDSVHMDVDLEIGGSDQMFNMMVGRDLMKKLKNKEKFVLTTKLLLDAKGEKIGKTTGNAINIANPANQFFGQIMNLNDDCILPCFKLITEVPMSRVGEIETALKAGENPMPYKKELAFALVKMLHNEKTAEAARRHFENVFEKRKLPEEIKTLKLFQNSMTLASLVTISKLATSRSEAKRLIKQGAVEVNQETVINPQETVKIPSEGIVLQVGKQKFLKITS